MTLMLVLRIITTCNPFILMVLPQAFRGKKQSGRAGLGELAIT